MLRGDQIVFKPDTQQQSLRWSQAGRVPARPSLGLWLQLANSFEVRDACILTAMQGWFAFHEEEERLEKLTGWATLKPWLQPRLSPSQGHRQKWAANDLWETGEVCPRREAWLEMGPVWQKKKSTAFDWLILSAGLLFLFFPIVFSQIAVN